jgi:hypothetical protein
MEKVGNMKTKIRLILGASFFTNNEPLVEIEDASELEEGHPTVRDAAIILYQCVGSGVMWNLSRKISEKTGFDLRKINQALEDTVREYAKMTEEEAYNDWWSTESSYIPTDESEAILESLKE